jgi:hypothetical protein
MVPQLYTSRPMFFHLKKRVRFATWWIWGLLLEIGNTSLRSVVSISNVWCFYRDISFMPTCTYIDIDEKCVNKCWSVHLRGRDDFGRSERRRKGDSKRDSDRFSVKVDSARLSKMEIRFRSLLHGIAGLIGRCMIYVTGWLFNDVSSTSDNTGLMRTKPMPSRHMSIEIFHQCPYGSFGNA